MRRVTRTPGAINVTLSEFLSGIERARARRAAFAEMSRPQRKEARSAKPEPQPRQRAALSVAEYRQAIARVEAHVASGSTKSAAVKCVAAAYGVGYWTLYHAWLGRLPKGQP